MMNFVLKSNYKFNLFNCLQKFNFAFHSRPNTCYYKILNISPDAPAEEIKKSYYKLAKRYHPDNKSTNAPANQNVSYSFSKLGEI